MSAQPRWWCLLACMVVALATAAQAQSTGTLQISMTVQPSIDLVFVQAPGGCPLANSGTNNVGLNLGWGEFSGGGSYSGCGTMKKVGGAWYQVRTPFNLVVTKSNSSSGSYRVSSWLGAPPPADVAYVLNSDANGNGGLVLSTSPQPLQAANTYGTTTEYFAVHVRNQAPAGALNATVYFLATAN